MRSIFYSWQADLDYEINKNVIKAAISIAINKTNLSIEDAMNNFLLDSDTTNRTGSPDIVNVILSKIDACSFFISDITPIAVAENGKKIPNPNVLFETGYAVGKKTFERTLFVLNEAYGKDVDMPFDLKTKRILSYTLHKEDGEDKKKEVIKRLASDVSKQLTAILNSPDLVDHDHDYEKQKRQRDLIKLKRFLENVSLKIISNHISRGMGENVMHAGAFIVQTDMEGVCSFFSFRLNDSVLANFIEELRVNFNHSLSFGLHFTFFNSNLYILKPHEDSVRDEYASCLGKLNESLVGLHDYIHDNYPEIDIEECNRVSYNKYIAELKNNTASFDE
ncbi:TIR domain-containing protein [Serratia proteamaculans]|uniref:TIR domain-containing protein n=1 Tax=Serratia proteamaculans TaxID=28151 RepID=UPI0039BE4E54